MGMVDELIMPEPKDHQQWSKGLEQLQNHVEAQTGNPHLWIACAGISYGEAVHFKRSYLTSVLPPVFHLPQMDIPLRNTKQTLAMAGLERNTKIIKLDYLLSSPNTNPIYTVPALMIDGIEGKEFIFNNFDNEDELASAVEWACKDVLGRTGGAGFPLLFKDSSSSYIRTVKRGVERADATALFYHRNSEESCSEGEVEEWLRKRRSGEEERVLILDEHVIRGWEASHLLVVAFDRVGLENLVVRAVGYCALVTHKTQREIRDTLLGFHDSGARGAPNTPILEVLEAPRAPRNSQEDLDPNPTLSLSEIDLYKKNLINHSICMSPMKFSWDLGSPGSPYSPRNSTPSPPN